jgi:hypothetical protein
MKLNRTSALIIGVMWFAAGSFIPFETNPLKGTLVQMMGAALVLLYLITDEN